MSYLFKFLFMRKKRPCRHANGLIQLEHKPQFSPGVCALKEFFCRTVWGFMKDWTAMSVWQYNSICCAAKYAPASYQKTLLRCN